MLMSILHCKMLLNIRYGTGGSRFNGGLLVMDDKCGFPLTSGVKKFAPPPQESPPHPPLLPFPPPLPALRSPCPKAQVLVCLPFQIAVLGCS